MADREREILAFGRTEELARWLDKHHRSRSELWTRIYQAASGIPSVTWAKRVVECLRFGWIDGQKAAFDEASFLQRIVPRKPKSKWSTRNRDLAEKLITEGRISPAGLAHVEAAKADGR